MTAPLILSDQWLAAARADPNLGIERFPELLTRHGDSQRWLATFDALPRPRPGSLELGDTIRIGSDADASARARQRLAELLAGLHPWRKGPWAPFGVNIDTEWRSDWKWARMAAHLAPLSERRILDVGCGNGYYGWRMCEAGAASVLGVDPTLVFVMQHAAMSSFIAAFDEQLALRNRLLPCRLEELGPTEPFDTLFALGVLYHRRDPLVHLRELRKRLRPGGELVLETLIIDHPGHEVLVPAQRYARMRNVWHVPSAASLLAWVEEAGFVGPRIIDVTPTTASEQRTTDWMTFESLAEALDPLDPTQTIEGYPAPIRAVVLANA